MHLGLKTLIVLRNVLFVHHTKYHIVHSLSLIQGFNRSICFNVHMRDMYLNTSSNLLASVIPVTFPFCLTSCKDSLLK